MAADVVHYLIAETHTIMNNTLNTGISDDYTALIPSNSSAIWVPFSKKTQVYALLLRDSGWFYCNDSHHYAYLSHRCYV